MKIEKCLGIAPNSMHENYYHFLYETLPKLIFGINLNFLNGNDDMKILVPSRESKLWYAVMNSFKVNDQLGISKVSYYLFL